MLGDAKAIVNRTITAGCIKPGCIPDVSRRHSSMGFGGFRAVGVLGDKVGPMGEGVCIAAVLSVSATMLGGMNRCTG